MAEVEFFQEQDWYFAVKPCKIPLGQWLAWAAKEPLAADSPVKEAPDRNVYFKFGDSRNAAIAKLKARLEVQQHEQTH